MMKKTLGIAIALTTLLVAGCTTARSPSTAKPRPKPPVTTSTKPAPAVAAINPADFVRTIDNPWFPLKPGTVYVSKGIKDGQPTTDTFAVTTRTKLILGVTCTVVSDTLTSKGRAVEKTEDWYTQDTTGSVWYFGEATEELDAKGNVIGTAGSWQAGVNGAEPGIFMPAKPRVGQSFRQEFYKGQAEDHFAILSLSASVSVPYGSFNNTLRTKEWTPLEPDVLDSKYYVRGIGQVKEITVKGPRETSLLVGLKRG